MAEAIAHVQEAKDDRGRGLRLVHGSLGPDRVVVGWDGKVRIYGECGTGRLLGAELFGPRVEHLSHLLAWAVQQGMTVHQALDMPFYHPVIEEGIRTALRDLAAKVDDAACADLAA